MKKNYIEVADIIVALVNEVLDCPPVFRNKYKLVIGQDYFKRIRKDDLEELNKAVVEITGQTFDVLPFVDGIYVHYDKVIRKKEEIKLDLDY